MRLQSKVVCVIIPAQPAVATVDISIPFGKNSHKKTMTAWTVQIIYSSSQCGPMEPAIASNHRPVLMKIMKSMPTALARTIAKSA